MVPTLYGRIQTRIILLAVFGGAWTLIVTPLLPDRSRSGPSYAASFTVLAVVLVVGVAWEILYHGLQQFRWEKDWPTLFGLITMVPEGAAVWWLITGDLIPGLHGLPISAFLVHFVSTWIVTWLIANGPLRIVSVRWRFSGGRFW
jgi:hypothetical protein